MPAFVKQGTNFAGTATTATPSISVSNAGDLLVVLFSGSSGSRTINTISDNNGNGNGWNKACGVLDATNTSDTEIWYCFNHASGATTITITPTGSGNLAMRAQVIEISGCNTLGIAVASTTGQSGTTQATPASGTLPTASQIVIGMVWHANTVSPTSGPTNSFNGLTAASSGSLQEGAYLVVSATTSISTSWTWASSSNYDSAIVSFYSTGSTYNMSATLALTGNPTLSPSAKLTMKPSASLALTGHPTLSVSTKATLVNAITLVLNGHPTLAALTALVLHSTATLALSGKPAINETAGKVLIASAALSLLSNPTLFPTPNNVVHETASVALTGHPALTAIEQAVLVAAASIALAAMPTINATAPGPPSTTEHDTQFIANLGKMMTRQ